ncbi:MAG: HIT family protein [Acidiferrobacterales bacterium]|nr:HIT family protein [Acidiferrobacterales bacterium]
MSSTTAPAELSRDDCRFCRPYPSPAAIQGEYCVARWDRHPANPGHMLVIPDRHFADYFDATEAERHDIWEVVQQARDLIVKEHNPDGFNVGINVGHYAGQSIMHLHVHIIPRYKGDVENPKGGVRGVIPQRQKYTLIP